MTKYQANLSHDGYTWTKKDGLTSGLKTFGVIQPESNIRSGGSDDVWEAIVIGAGYAGLIAARDLVKAGKSNFQDERSAAESVKARKLCCWRLEIVLVVGHGVPKLTALPSKWAAPGSRMFTGASSPRCRDTVSRMMSP